jgi:Ca2+-binding EF-hand superfamily protein
MTIRMKIRDMKIRKRAQRVGFSVLIAPAILAVGMGTALAQPPGGKGPPRMMEHFEALDLNGDGKVTAEEIALKRAERFAKADADGDGALSRNELELMAEQRRRERMDRHFACMDGDGDGKVSADEFAASRAGWFKRIDRDGDGAVTLEELKSYKRPGPR